MVKVRYLDIYVACFIVVYALHHTCRADVKCDRCRYGSRQRLDSCHSSGKARYYTSCFERSTSRFEIQRVAWEIKSLRMIEFVKRTRNRQFQLHSRHLSCQCIRTHGMDTPPGIHLFLVCFKERCGLLLVMAEKVVR